MKIGVLICVLMLTLSGTPVSAVETGAFEQAKRIGEANERSFFLFSTSIGHYAIRHDGMGEVSINARRRVFFLKVGAKARLAEVYFHEYQGDVVFVYEVSDGTVYVARMNQKTRKTRWLTAIDATDIGSCVVAGSEAHCGPAAALTTIDLNTGALKTTA